MTDSDLSAGAVLEAVPVFPLPQVVLFPGALMPLHIFEPRYRAMTRDVLATDGLLVIAQVPEDHEVDRMGQPSFCQIATLGRIVRHDPLPDGRFNILVKGEARVRSEELPLDKPYRRVRATVLETSGAPSAAETQALGATAAAFARRVRQSHPAFDFSVEGTEDPGALADQYAHYLVLDGADRQSLLETLDDGQRVEACLAILMRQVAALSDDGVLH